MSLQESARNTVSPNWGKACAVTAILVLGSVAVAAGLGALDRPMPMASSESNGNAAARPRAVQQPIACEKLPNVPGKSITTVLVSFPPMAFTPRHRHPGSVTAYVLKGTLRSQLNDGPVGTFTTGGTWFEPPGTIHSMVENPSPSEPAEIMAIFVADTDCGALTIFDD
jgi:quercetin dioxygenase-like cupin family protein